MKAKLSLTLIVFFSFCETRAQWQRVANPTYIPSVSALTSNNKYIYAATYNALFRSVRGTYDWERLSLPSTIRSLDIRALAVEDSLLFFGTSGGEVFGSYDEGQTWIKKEAEFSFGSVWTIAVQSRKIIVGADRGVFLSDDSGNSWRATQFIGERIYVMSLLFFEEKIFAGTYGSGVYVSTDGGNQWTSTNNGLTYHFIRSLGKKGGTLYAGTSDNFLDSVPVFESTDGGNSWHELSNGLPRPTYSEFGSFATDGDRLLVATSRNGVYEFSEQDSAWKPLNTGLKSDPLPAGSLLWDGETFLAGSSKGVLRFDAIDSSWVPITNGLTLEISQIYTLSGRDTLLLAGTGGSIYRSDNLGETWKQAEIAGASNTFLCFLLNDEIILSGNSYGLFRSLDNGISWSRTSIPFGVPALAAQGEKIFASVAEFYFHPFDSYIFVSENNGETWSNSAFGQLTLRYVRALHATEECVFAASVNTVFRSDDGGLHWKTFNNALPEGIGIITLHAVGDVLLAGTTNGIYISDNKGETWVNQSAGLDAQTANAFATAGGVHLAATNKGVFFTQELSAPWQPLNEGLSGNASIVRAILIVGNRLFIGTEDGIWRRPLSEIITSVRDDTDALLLSFVLHQNYPNPFNPTTVITYEVPVRSNISLKIFNMLGQDVATLVNGEVGAGTYEVRWDASEFPTGLYFYQLQGGTYVETKKLLLLK